MTPFTPILVEVSLIFKTGARASEVRAGEVRAGEVRGNEVRANLCPVTLGFTVSFAE